jgi:hypothetical protein
MRDHRGYLQRVSQLYSLWGLFTHDLADGCCRLGQWCSWLSRFQNRRLVLCGRRRSICIYSRNDWPVLHHLGNSTNRHLWEIGCPRNRRGRFRSGYTGSNSSRVEVPHDELCCSEQQLPGYSFSSNPRKPNRIKQRQSGCRHLRVCEHHSVWPDSTAYFRYYRKH